MQYDVKTPAEYMAALDKDWRLEKLEQLRSLIKAKGPELEEGIRYKMLSYGDDKGVIFQLNAQRNYVSLYIGDAKKVDPQGRLLEGVDVGKGCIRFKKSTVIEATRIEEFVEKAIDMWRRGEDVDC